MIVRNGREERRVVDRRRAEIAIDHLCAELGAVELPDLGISACEEYLDARRPASDPTVRRELVVLVAALNHGVRREHFDFNTKRIVLPAASMPNERWLTHDELARLRGAASPDPRLSAFVEIAYFTASRRRAVEALEWSQVRFDTNSINLAKPGEQRTKKRRPTVPMDTALRPTLEMAFAVATTPYVLGHTGDLLGAFGRVVERAGLGGDVTPQTLRHTRASHLLQAGVTIWDVAKLLGDTVDTVERTYGHHCVGALGERLSGK